MKSSSSRNAFAIGITGLCVGWLVGLSVSPVIGTVLGSIMAIAAAAVSVLAGLDPAGSDEKPTRFHGMDGTPLMLLVLGLALGATAGLWVRANGVLIRAAGGTASAGGLSLDTARARYANVGLMNITISSAECDRMRSQLGSPDELKTEMAAARDPILRAVALSPAADSAVVFRLVEAVCAR
jgi:hypothetical protein